MRAVSSVISLHAASVVAFCMLTGSSTGCGEADLPQVNYMAGPIARELMRNGAGEERFIELDRASVSMETLTRSVSIEKVMDDRIFAYASDFELGLLQEQGIEWREIAHPGKNRGAKMGIFKSHAYTLPDVQWDAYPTYAEYVELMEALAAAYPHLCRLESIGKTNNEKNPHELLVMKITARPGIEEDEPEVFYTSTMHGDETAGYAVLLRLIYTLLTEYDTDPAIRRLVDEVEIWINPLANPDGTYFGGDDTVEHAIRYYVSSDGESPTVDPNRSFPEARADAELNVEWPETQRMVDFASKHSFVAGFNIHGGSEVLNYPWDSFKRRHPDDAWFIAMSTAYAKQAQGDGPDDYMKGLEDGITNGWDWYSIHGGRQDFMNYWHSCREVTLEMSWRKNPRANELPVFWEANRQALLTHIETSLTGIRGLVRTPKGAPVHARVEVVGHDILEDGSAVRTDPDVGDYHRPIEPGVYTLRFSAKGYGTQEVSDVLVKPGQSVRVDVMLLPGAG